MCGKERATICESSRSSLAICERSDTRAARSSISSTAAASRSIVSCSDWLTTRLLLVASESRILPVRAAAERRCTAGS